MSNNLVSDWMTPQPITIPTNCLLRDAYWLMIEHNVRRLPVLDGERLVGIITLEDVRRIEPPTGFGLDLVRITNMLSKMTVSQIMSRDPRTIAPDALLIAAARMMLEYKISSLPVVSGSHLVGIITESDIFQAFVKLETEKLMQ